MVRFLGAGRPADLIRNRLPNVVFSPGRVQSHLLGSGWGERADGHRVVADALDDRAARRRRRGRLEVPARRAPAELAAHPARGRAGQAAGPGPLLGHGRPGPRRVRRGRPDRCDRAAEGGDPARGRAGVPAGARGRARPGVDGPGRFRRRTRRNLCRLSWPPASAPPPPACSARRCRPSPPAVTRDRSRRRSWPELAAGRDRATAAAEAERAGDRRTLSSTPGRQAPRSTWRRSGPMSSRSRPASSRRR